MGLRGHLVAELPFLITDLGQDALSLLVRVCAGQYVDDLVCHALVNHNTANSQHAGKP